MTINFGDKATEMTVKTIWGNINWPIDPSKTAPHRPNIDTGYTAAQGNQFGFMKYNLLVGTEGPNNIS
jgi:hypothetical protein